LFFFSFTSKYDFCRRIRTPSHPEGSEKEHNNKQCEYTAQPSSSTFG